MDLSTEWKTPGVCGVRGPKQQESEDKAAPESLQEREEDFFTVVAAGNMSTLKQFLKKHRKPDGSLDFDVNCTNFQNDTAMSIAVDKNNLEMIKCLAQLMDVTKNSILLKAIRGGDFDLVRCLCETLNVDEEALENRYNAPQGEADYTSCVTPLMVAASEGHYEIVGYLLERGHKIPEPHKPGCLCDEGCKTVLAISDPLHLSSLQFQTYAAIGNPAYIPYATADPIHYCFRLHRRLKLLSEVDPPFRSSYNALASQVDRFAANLVSECRTFKEIELVLKQPYNRKNIVQSEFPRLLMALDFNQQQFLTEPNVQLFIQMKFHGDFGSWAYYSEFQKLKFILVRIITAPIACWSFMANPTSTQSKVFAAPVNKMLHFIATYLVFLWLLFMETREPKPEEHRHKMNSPWTYLIFLYFYSFAGLIAYQIVAAGLKNFLRQSWNVYDLLMAIVFSLFVAFSISSWVHVRMPKVGCTERKSWTMFDPQLLAEGFLVTGTILAYMKLLFFLQLSRVFGPLLVALCQLTRYLMWFCLFGAIVLLGYSVAFSHFYSYYSGMSYTDPETKTNSTQEESFTDALSTFKTFFWGIFGLSGSSAADVVLDNDNRHIFTETVGYTALGSFLLLMILVFKSMMIAMSVKTHQNRNQHETWLYRRARIFLYFIDLPLLPPPFNLLPHRYTGRSKCDLEKPEQDCDPVEAYKALAKALVERYFSTKLKNNERLGSNHKGVKAKDPSKKFTKTRCRSL